MCLTSLALIKEYEGIKELGQGVLGGRAAEACCQKLSSGFLWGQGCRVGILKSNAVNAAFQSPFQV